MILFKDIFFRIGTRNAYEWPKSETFCFFGVNSAVFLVYYLKLSMKGVTHFDALECKENWELHCLSCINWDEFTLRRKAFLYEATCHQIRFSKGNKQVLQNECFQMKYQQEQNTLPFINTEAKITLQSSKTTHQPPRPLEPPKQPTQRPKLRYNQA